MGYFQHFPFRAFRRVFACFCYLHIGNPTCKTEARSHPDSRSLDLEVFTEMPHAGCFLIEKSKGHEGEFPGWMDGWMDGFQLNG